MAQTAAHLVDHVIPNVPVRQWVLSLPIPLRVLLLTVQGTMPRVFKKILSHLGLQARAPPRAPARGQALQAA